MLLFYFTLFHFGNCANILAALFLPYVSHQAVFQKIWRQLSLNGHNVTVITPNPLKDPSLINLTEIDVSHLYDVMDISTLLANHPTPDQVWAKASLQIFPSLWKESMKNEKVRALVENREGRNFDLVLVEMLWAPVYAFSKKYDCPFVGLITFPDFMTANKCLGIPTHPIISPDPFLGFGSTLSFKERLLSVYFYSIIYLRYEFEIMPTLDRYARNYFGDEIPYLGEIEKNVSLILSSTNMLVSKPKPKVSALVELGNVHIKNNTNLPKDLKDILDKESKGMIYFSLGSNVKSVNISPEIKRALISTFSELPFKILWKWESDHLPGKPENVITRKWLPQEAVLAHPNVKVFVTQGGLQSLDEAIFYKKPMVGMPFIVDQKKNVKSIVENGIGVEVNTFKLTKDKLKSAILEVFHNEKYKEKITEISDIIWDQPLSGLDTAVWWIEYVIRHKGAKYLRSPLLDMPSYQYFLLDVIAFILFIIISIITILYLIYKFVKRFIMKMFVSGRKLKMN